MRLRGLVVAVAAAATLSGCMSSPLPPAGARYLPKDSVFVLSLDIPTLASTRLFKQLQESGGSVGINRINLLKFARAAGLDPFKDVKWLTFVGRKRGDGEIPIDELSAVASGLDGKKAYGFLKDSGLPSEAHEGTDIFPFVIVKDRCRFCVGVLDDTTAAFGDGETLRSMAEVRNTAGDGLAFEPEVSRLLARVDRKAAVWGVVRGPNLSGALTDLLARVQGGQAGSGALSPISNISFFATSGENIVVAVDAVAASNEDALLIADVLEGAGALGKLALKQVKPEASSLLSSFKVQVDGAVIRATASVPESRLAELAEMATGSLFNGAFSGMAIPSGPPAGR